MKDAYASFTDQVRQELSNLAMQEPWAELVGLVRCSGSLHRDGGHRGWTLTITSPSGAVARRSFSLIQRVLELRPELAVRSAGGMHRQMTYQVRLTASRRIAENLGLLDTEGRLQTELPVSADDPRAPHLLRGAVLGCASFSTPGRDAHLEFTPGTPQTARALADLLRHHLTHQVTVVGAEASRVVVKSGEAIGEILVLIGAVGAFLRWDEHRMRRQLREDATRLANADAANLRRSTSASAEQIQVVEEVIRRHGWDGLDDELREVALVRLANPVASLQELGALLDPPVGKSAVHRRLRRLSALLTM